MQLSNHNYLRYIRINVGKAKLRIDLFNAIHANIWDNLCSSKVLKKATQASKQNSTNNYL